MLPPHTPTLIGVHCVFSAHRLRIQSSLSLGSAPHSVLQILAASAPWPHPSRPPSSTRSPSLHLSLESLCRQLSAVTVELASSISCVTEITVLHCPAFHIWKNILCWEFGRGWSYLRKESKSHPSHFILATNEISTQSFESVQTCA